MKRDIRLYWWGQTTSALGSSFTAIALPIIAVIRLGATPGQIGVLSASAILPTMLLGLPAGALADRVSRPRRTLIALDTVSAVMIATVALGLARGDVTIAWLAVLNALGGCVGILVKSVYFIHLNQLVGVAGIGPVRARLQAGQYGAGFAGRLLAGPAIVLFGSTVALSVDSVSYLLSATALLAMSPVPASRRARPDSPARERTKGAGSIVRTARELAIGARLFTGDAFHRALLVFIMMPVISMAGVAALTAPFLLHVVHVPTGAYGAVAALGGLMGLAGSVAARRILRPHRDPRIVTLAMFMASASAALMLPLASGPVPVAACVAALGISVPVFFGAIANVALSPILVIDAGENAMGRTMAMLQVIVAVGGLLGALTGGALGDWIGVRQAVWALDLGGLAAMALALPSALHAARSLRAAAAEAPPPAVASEQLVEVVVHDGPARA